MEMFSLALPLRLRVLAAHRAPALGVMEPSAGPGPLLIWIRKQGPSDVWGEQSLFVLPGEPGGILCGATSGWVGRRLPSVSLHSPRGKTGTGPSETTGLDGVQPRGSLDQREVLGRRAAPHRGRRCLPRASGRGPVLSSGTAGAPCLSSPRPGSGKDSIAPSGCLTP